MAASGTSSTSPTEIAMAFFRQMASGDVRAMMALVANDATAWMPGHGNMTHEQLHEFLEHANERFVEGSLVLKPIGTTAEGERVAIEAESSALLKTGGEYGNRYHLLFVVRNGKIRTLNVYTDSALAVVAAWTGEPVK